MPALVVIQVFLTQEGIGPDLVAHRIGAHQGSAVGLRRIGRGQDGRHQHRAGVIGKSKVVVIERMGRRGIEHGSHRRWRTPCLAHHPSRLRPALLLHPTRQGQHRRLMRAGKGHTQGIGKTQNGHLDGPWRQVVRADNELGISLRQGRRVCMQFTHVIGLMVQILAWISSN
jgi:hypothetical protein